MLALGILEDLWTCTLDKFLVKKTKGYSRKDILTIKMDIWSRMSAVVAEHVAVTSDQPTATRIGIDILKMGGNAADAAIATMAVVSVIQPMTCGIGGDCHCLFYKKTDRKLYAINGSGRTGEYATLEKIQAAGIVDTTAKEFFNHGLWVSVPGTVAGMCSVLKHFGSGKLTMQQILEPAIKVAEEGIPVGLKTTFIWNKFKDVIENSKRAEDVLLQGKKIPLPGEKLYAPKLAHTFKLIASHGEAGFYCGTVAQNIVKEVECAGGVLTLNDMKEHLKFKLNHELQEPLFIDFCGFRIWEMKPNTIGIIVLVALNILQLYDLKALGHNSAEYIHIVSEAIKYAYLECWDYLCDPSYNSPCFKLLLSENLSRQLKMQIDDSKAFNSQFNVTGSNTSYVAVVDEEGNGCSFICSISSDFGTGLIPEDCGFTLHDRLKCMSLHESSPNAFGPKKLPLHSIIPSMVTDIETNELLALVGICGRWMQPTGQIQLYLNMIIFGMDPQTALNQPRFYVGNWRTLTNYTETFSVLSLEEGIPISVVPILKEKGHDVTHSSGGLKRILFGKGNIIAQPVLWDKNYVNHQKSWWAGADPRTDGCAMGF